MDAKTHGKFQIAIPFRRRESIGRLIPNSEVCERCQVERALPRTLNERVAGDGGPTRAFHPNSQVIVMIFPFPEHLASLRQINK